MIKVIHDGDLDIATQTNNFSDPIISIKTSWSKFINQISKSVATEETHAQYLKMSKDQQGLIKNVGGFVGGLIHGTHRIKTAVVNRTILTLDVDNGVLDQFDRFTLLYDSAACLYSTHSHSESSPSYRLIIPLLRPVDGDEFEAVSRKLVKILDPGKTQFCSTSFVRHQIMFWPSHSKDVIPVFEFQDGQWMDPDEILATYNDWRDITEWDGLGKIKIGDKQEDPLLKEGPVGVFCRTYDIHETIEKFIPDYKRNDAVRDRYTYIKGTTSNGVVTYDDKYSYSHHSSDPTSEKLCNAFDLVRLHLYGEEDLKAKPNTPGNRMPSYKKMVDLMDQDRSCKIRYIREKQDQAKVEFSEKYVDEEGDVVKASEKNKKKKEKEKKKVAEDNLEWAGDLETEHGQILPTRNNIVLIMTNDGGLKESFRYDDFSKRAMVTKLPWREVTAFTNELQNSDLANLRHYIEWNYKIDNIAKIKDCLEIVLQRNKFHPVKEYLEKLVWDGVERLETIFVDFLGAQDTEFTRAATRKQLSAAVARIYEPGIKFDTMIVFMGNQGKGKSWVVDKLGMRWFSDTLGSLHSKEAMENLQGIWLLEIPELSQFKRSDIETVKAFVSKREDRFRVPYSEMSSNFPRQCVMFGTSNEYDPLQDQTGNRRFWPIDVTHSKGRKNVFTELNQFTVDQVWAEAVESYMCGETLYLDEQLEFEARIVQERHTVHDPREEMILNYLNQQLPSNWDEMEVGDRKVWLSGIDPMQEKGIKTRQYVCAQEIWCEVLGEHPGKINGFNTRFIHAFMRKLDNWKPGNGKRIISGYGNVKFYELGQQLSGMMNFDDLM